MVMYLTWQEKDLKSSVPRVFCNPLRVGIYDNSLLKSLFSFLYCGFDLSIRFSQNKKHKLRKQGAKKINIKPWIVLIALLVFLFSVASV
mmetsp:Transcript_17537/g.43745  ORF Transcript_17537/g.43745 Transcript_17537/m.43745 type:complete len:89 (+) Transcript_17537:364-630(+)